jgi:hypothetical protein
MRADEFSVPSLDSRQNRFLSRTSSGVKVSWCTPEVEIVFGCRAVLQDPASGQTSTWVFGYIVTRTVINVFECTSSLAAGRTTAETLIDALRSLEKTYPIPIRKITAAAAECFVIFDTPQFSGA